MDGGTHGHHFVGVHTLGRLLAEVGFHRVLHGRDAGGATHEDDFVDVALVEAGGLQSAHARLDGALDEAVDQLLKLRTGQAAHQVLGHAVHRHDVRKVDLRAGGAGELDLRLLGSFLQALKGHGVLAEVESAVLALEFVHEPLDDGLVKVVPAQVRVAVGGKHFEDAVAEFEDAHVVRATTQVKDHDFLVGGLFVQSVCQSCGCRLVDDAFHLKAGNFSGFLGGLTLAVVEVGGNGDDRTGDFLAEVLSAVRFIF